MSLIDLEPAKAHAGQLFCACDADAPDDVAVAEQTGLVPIALGFGLTIVVQALLIAVLPIAGAEIAPQPLLATLPYALTLVGALAASVPAAILSDVIGRKSAFALGASLGLAGAVLAGWSLVERNFAGLALGGFWLGTAQGFGFFFRHSAALASKHKARAIAIVLGAGSLAAFAAPALMSLAERSAGPLAPSAALLLAGVVQVLLLALSLALPGKPLAAAKTSETMPVDSVFLIATIAGFLAWFGMALMMAASPIAMAHCGIGLGGRSEVISWHILAMYAPAAVLGFLPKQRGDVFCLVGLAMLAAAIAVMMHLSSLIDFGVTLIAAGCGWSLTMFGAMLMLHARGALARPMLALHDAALFGGAMIGALAAAFLH
jgi:MFS family permease